LALLGGNLVKRGVEQADLKPSDPMWLKTEQILADHHSKFSKALAHHGAVLETMQANLQAGFVKIGALLLAALIAGIAALASALHLNKHLSEQGIGAMRAQFQGLRSQMDQLAHAQAAMSAPGRDSSAAGRASPRQSAAASTRSSEPARDEGRETGIRGSVMSSAVAAGAAAAAGLSLAELAAKVALASDADEASERASVIELAQTNVQNSANVVQGSDNLQNTGLSESSEDNAIAFPLDGSSPIPAGSRSSDNVASGTVDASTGQSSEISQQNTGASGSSAGSDNANELSVNNDALETQKTEAGDDSLHLSEPSKEMPNEIQESSRGSD
jgi:hypothetical protein